MINILEHKGVKALIAYDPDIEMFRGEILGLAGSADFYSEDVKGLKNELEISLNTYLEVCNERKMEPFKAYNGKISYRTNKDTHQKLELLAASHNMSINKILDKMVENELDHFVA
ncbi:MULTISPECIES: type II toxin-antitoxin system HicB family antitoxin [Vibrio]|uniref:type II toxin-antitoxin system HicB family antitoxin n=1 Tax=Vibrio TaxID=662 RepID=UPI0003E226BF|nr:MULTISPECIES: type II toxin-antitoxin system HicB family antitoxin [Vibrio]EGR0036481.1 type II toxin-antitoxin system HicB family antitoxin [Vibrio parahaemolyticus]EGR0204805.1 type II toxin-antitoxin system HicB family antitoxin [Vibrio parahaemolyticus]EGR2784280.1 type II toxin-antitoxin system HicB family antitoxin [Vibrio parahaemolyticus]EGR9083711.1 type II toxin-antitoxin system HicB family antitoxin [Vibrio parahaemolyticus]EHS1223180.1 type II toxin-antitoxin system HicB family 